MCVYEFLESQYFKFYVEFMKYYIFRDFLYMFEFYMGVQLYFLRNDRNVDIGYFKCLILLELLKRLIKNINIQFLCDKYSIILQGM